jgi:hypothetical protein
MDVLGVEGDVIRWDERIYGGSLATLLDVLAGWPTSPRRAAAGKFFPTAAVAHLRMPHNWRRLGRSAGRVITIMRPRSLQER